MTENKFWDKPFTKSSGHNRLIWKISFVTFGKLYICGELGTVSYSDSMDTFFKTIISNATNGFLIETGVFLAIC